MRAAFWLVALFALAVGLTLAARFDQGYVLIVYPPWRVEMSFMLGLVLALLLFFVGYAGLRLLRVALRLPEDVKGWRERRRRNCAERALQEAMAALLAGHHAKAIEEAERASACGNPELASLIAAEAARASGRPEQAGRFLIAAEGKQGEVEAARNEISRQLAGSAPPR